MTHKASQAFLNIQVNSYELTVLTRSHSGHSEALSLGLEFEVAEQTCWEHVLNKALLDSEGKLELHKASAQWQALWKYSLR
jgi:hypothetical protein